MHSSRVTNSKPVPGYVERAFADLVGAAPAFRRALDLAGRAAATDCSVLIVGETGTGKELFARALHRASARREKPFVAINCGAIARELIGSELFGHERGAFTGATRDRDGVFVQAHGGTLFLDELGELPLDQQPHLLRVLETRTVRRLGSESDRPVDVRVVAATNQLHHLGHENSALRLDLFHRVATVVLHLPPLRERAEDIPVLVRAFMAEFAPDLGEYRVAPATMRALVAHPWPGNIRELRHAIMRAMALGSGELLEEHLFPAYAVRAHESDPPQSSTSAPRDSAHRATTRRNDARESVLSIRVRPDRGAELRPIDRIIRRAMIDALRTHKSLRSAARSLGMARSTFSDWSKRLGIECEQTHSRGEP